MAWATYPELTCPRPSDRRPAIPDGPPRRRRSGRRRAAAGAGASAAPARGPARRRRYDAGSGGRPAAPAGPAARAARGRRTPRPAAALGADRPVGSRCWCWRWSAGLGGWFYARGLNDDLARTDPFAGLTDGRPAKTVEGALNILLVGSDSRDPDAPINESSQWRADTVILMHIPSDHTAAYLVSIPRDLYVPIPEMPARPATPASAPRSTRRSRWAACRWRYAPSSASPTCASTTSRRSTSAASRR